MSNRHTPALSESRRAAVRDVAAPLLANYREMLTGDDEAKRAATEYDILLVMGLSIGATEESAKLRNEVIALLAELP